MGVEFTLVHVSDLHFGVKDGIESFVPEVGDEMLRAVESLRPDVVVVSGDLSIAARPEELARARAYLDRMQAPRLFVVPGNHDARGALGLEPFRRLIGPTEPSLTLPGLRLVGIDSTEEHAEEAAKGRKAVDDDWVKAARMSKGYVGPEQYPRIVAELAAAEPGDVKVAVLHHHLIGIPGVGIDTDPLIDSGDVLCLLLRCGADLVLAGHKHRPWLWEVNDLPILHSGTSTSRRYKAGVHDNFYNVVRMGAELLELTRVSLTSGDAKVLRSAPVGKARTPHTVGELP